MFYGLYLAATPTFLPLSLALSPSLRPSLPLSSPLITPALIITRFLHFMHLGHSFTAVKTQREGRDVCYSCAFTLVRQCFKAEIPSPSLVLHSVTHFSLVSFIRAG